MDQPLLSPSAVSVPGHSIAVLNLPPSILWKASVVGRKRRRPSSSIWCCSSLSDYIEYKLSVVISDRYCARVTQGPTHYDANSIGSGPFHKVSAAGASNRGDINSHLPLGVYCDKQTYSSPLGCVHGLNSTAYDGSALSTVEGMKGIQSSQTIQRDQRNQQGARGAGDTNFLATAYDKDQRDNCTWHGSRQMANSAGGRYGATTARSEDAEERRVMEEQYSEDGGRLQGLHPPARRYFIFRRYRDFRDLYCRLRTILPTSPEWFPPKRLCLNMTGDFLDERQRSLDYYLQILQRLDPRLLSQSLADFLDVSARVAPSRSPIFEKETRASRQLSAKMSSPALTEIQQASTAASVPPSLLAEQTQETLCQQILAKTREKFFDLSDISERWLDDLDLEARHSFYKEILTCPYLPLTSPSLAHPSNHEECLPLVLQPIPERLWNKLTSDEPTAAAKITTSPAEGDKSQTWESSGQSGREAPSTMECGPSARKLLPGVMDVRAYFTTQDRD